MKEMLNANIWRVVSNKFYWLFTIVSGLVAPVAVAIYSIVKEYDCKTYTYYQVVSGIFTFYLFAYVIFIIFWIIYPYINSKCVNATIARGVSRTRLFFGMLIEEIIHIAFWSVTASVGAIVGAVIVGGRGFQTIHMISENISNYSVLIFSLIVVNLVILLFDNAILGLIAFLLVAISPVELVINYVPSFSQMGIGCYFPIAVINRFWVSLFVYHSFEGVNLILGIIYFLLVCVISLSVFKKKELDF